MIGPVIPHEFQFQARLKAQPAEALLKLSRVRIGLNLGDSAFSYKRCSISCDDAREYGSTGQTDPSLDASLPAHAGSAKHVLRRQDLCCPNIAIKSAP